MRFFEDGPAIPDSLLEQSDAGNVVFFCGAGISRYPKGQGPKMPSFVKLAKRVVKYSGAPPDSELRDWLEAIKKDKNHESMQLDDIFNSLKDPNFLGREVVNQKVTKILNSENSSAYNLGRHKHISQISRNSRGFPRIVTTNFDVLFERAVKDRKMKIHLPPIKTSSSKKLATGIIYLHGRTSEITNHVSENKVLNTNLILSTSDFGEAYLSNGWAAEFIRFLFSSYIVVFIGYGASDVPIRYMLSGLRNSHYTDHQNLYVFDKGNLEVLKEKWKGRGVQPIPYANHYTLWKTIEAWAERAEDPTKWKRSVLRLTQGDPRRLKPHERRQVYNAVHTVDGIRRFGGLDPAAHAGWVNVLDDEIRLGKPLFRSRPEDFNYVPQLEYGLDGESSEQSDSKEKSSNKDKRKIPRTAKNPCARKKTKDMKSEFEKVAHKSVTAWMCKNINSPIIAWWVARQSTLETRRINSLKRALAKCADINSSAKLMWQLILDGHFEETQVSLRDSWTSLCFDIKKNRGKWQESTFRLFQIATTPSIRAESTRGISRFVPPEGSWDTVKLKKVANLVVKFPDRYTASLEIGEEALPRVVKILQNNLILASKLRYKVQSLYGGKIDSPTCYQNRCVRGEIRYTEFNSAVVMFLKLFNILTSVNSAAAKSIAKKWSTSDRYFFRKLKLYALNQESLFEIDEVAFHLSKLSREEFWCENSRRELLFLISDRWNEFSEQQRQNIIDKILSPPYNLIDQDEEDSSEMAKFRVATFGRWLVSQGCEFPSKSMRQLNDIVGSIGDWKESYASDTVMIYESVYTRGVTVEAHSSISRSDPSLASRTKFDQLTELSIENALLKLIDAKRENIYPLKHWKLLIEKWPVDAPKPLSRKFMRQLTGLPQDVLCELKYELGSYLKRKHIHMFPASPRLSWSVFDCCIDAWMEDFDISKGQNEDDDILYRSSDRDSKRTYGYSIQRPVGMATLFLMDIVMNGSNGMPIVIKRRLNRILANTSEARHQCVSILAKHIPILRYADASWTKRSLFPFFEYEHELEEAALSGIASSCFLVDVDTFKFLKHRIFNMYPRVYEFFWSDSDYGGLALLNVLAGTIYFNELDKREKLEVTNCFRVMNENGKLDSILHLQNIAINEKDGWVRYVIPFFKSVWPKDQPFRNENVTKSLIILLSHTGEFFPEVFSAVKDFLVSFSDDSHATASFCIKGGGEDGLISKFPDEALELFDIVISSEMKYPPVFLGKILSIISKAKKPLEGDRRYRRLHRLAKKADSQPK